VCVTPAADMYVGGATGGRGGKEDQGAPLSTGGLDDTFETLSTNGRMYGGGLGSSAPHNGIWGGGKWKNMRGALHP